MSRRHGRFTQRRFAGFVTAGLVLAAAASVCAQAPVTPPGLGTQGDPYLISELGHLVWMGDNVGASSGKYYSLTADIDASATAGWNDVGTGTDVLEGFKPIGTYSSPDTTSFQGIFDGNGHILSGLVVNRPATEYVGLFGRVGLRGKVRNLGLIGGAVTGSSFVGGLVGDNFNGAVSNCCATCTVTGTGRSVGGLVGCNSQSGTVSKCYAAGAVTGTEGDVGGLVGSNYSTVSNCYATGAVAGTGSYVGGLVGYNYRTLSNCYATGAVTGSSADAGGLVGRNSSGTVSNCHATGAVAGNESVGGLVGYNDSSGAVSNCFASGAVTGSRCAGGLVGTNTTYGAVSNCYATGTVTGSESVGGLVGENYYYGTVSNCYATGAVTGLERIGGLVGTNGSGTVWDCYASGAARGSSLVGGLVGFNFGTVLGCYATGAVTGLERIGGLVGLGSGGTVTNSYWDMQASGQSTSAGGTGKTTAEMKRQATFTGWAFTNVWGILEGTSYPYLRFWPSPFRLTVDSSGPGSVTIDPPSADGTYAPGTLVTLTAVPNGPTAILIRWAGAVPVESSTVTVVMDIHRSVTAVFVPRIEINSLADLAKIGNAPGYPLADVLYVLTADIDASATAGWNDAGTDTKVLEGFKPIGTYYPDTASFRGVFDGSGHTISGLVVNRPAANYVGFFGRVGTFGQVQNLGLVGGAVMGMYSVGGLVGSTSGTVLNCYATGAVTGIGGVGGLVGSTSGTVLNCHAAGAVTGRDRVGGLVGSTFGTVSNCYAAGVVTGGGSVGGLAGYSSSNAVSNCYATGAVTGTTYKAGGLVGDNYFGTVSNCYATGAVTGASDVGGLVGYDSHGTVWNCYATGAVTGPNDVGGLVGRSSVSTVSNSYWDMQTSGQSSSAGGTGKTTAEMKQQATFAGWDFADVWGIRENITYPWLRGLDADGDGIPDLQDDCVDSDLAATIVIDGCNTGVANRPLGEGCTMADEIGTLAVDARNHGAFTSAVARLTNAWVKAGLITGAEKGRIQRCVGRADFDADGDVDMADFLRFQGCFNGPNRQPKAGCTVAADLDADADVDLADFLIFRGCFTGPNP